jgi:RNA polymerase sigma-70 factor (ECF subfamily)
MQIVAASAYDDGDVSTDSAGFERFHDAEYRGLLRLGYVLTGSAGTAEELVQETMLRTYRHWRKVREYDQPGAWARRVLVNLATSRGRRLAAETRAMVRLRGNRPPEPAAREDATALWAELRKLPARQQQCLALHYVDDLTVAQIAALLECPEGTVKALMHRGRATLARALGDEDDAEEAAS